MPDTNTIMLKTATYTSAVPKSGCATISKSGMETYATIGNRSRNVFISSTRWENGVARDMIIIILPNSEGWNERSEDAPHVKKAVILPRPASAITSTESSKRILKT